MTLASGTAFASYRIIEPLGRGGMASVYKAYEATLDRHVAVKVLPAEFLHDPNFAERFQREAKVVARLEHPNIIPIYAYGIDQEQRIPWMAMRLVPGGALSSIVRGSSRRLPFGRTLAILKGAAEALDYAHGKGVVHRDVKPQNILLDEAERVYLADFGIAKMVESSAGLTQTGMITGTPQYMAPEQATGLTVDKRADIYALGIVAFEMFTGRVPFTADTPVAILMKHVSEALPLPPVSEVPESLMRAVLKCTAKQPDDRWPSASAFVQALELGLAEASSAEASVASVGAAFSVREAPQATTHVPSTASSSPTFTPRLTGTRPAPRPPAPPSTGLSATAVLAIGGLLVAVLLGAGGLFLFLVLRPAPEVDPRPSVAVASPAGTSNMLPPAHPSAEPQMPETRAPFPEASRATPDPFPTPLSTPLPASTPFQTAPSVTPTVEPVHPSAAPTSVPSPREPPRAVEPEASGQVRALMDTLTRSSSADDRWRAAETLGGLGDEARPAVPALSGALRDRNDQVRWRSAEALGKLGVHAASAVPALADSLDRSDMLAQESAKALGRMGAAARPAVPALALALTRDDVYLRREAAKALVKLAPYAQDAVPTLIEVLQDKDRTVRAEACKVLGRIGPAARAALPALEAASRDPDDLVRVQANDALKRVSAR